MFGGGSVNMCKAQIYVKNIKKTENNTPSWEGWGGVSSLNWRGLYPPPSGVNKYHCQ